MLIRFSTFFESNFILSVVPWMQDVLGILTSDFPLDLLDYAGSTAFRRGISRLSIFFEPSKDISSSRVFVAFEPIDSAGAEPILHALRLFASCAPSFPIELAYLEGDSFSLGHVSTSFAVECIVGSGQTADGWLEGTFVTAFGGFDLLPRDVGKDVKRGFSDTFGPLRLPFRVQLGELDPLFPSHDFFNSPPIVVVLHRDEAFVDHLLSFGSECDFTSGSGYSGCNPNLFKFWLFDLKRKEKLGPFFVQAVFDDPTSTFLKP